MAMPLRLDPKTRRAWAILQLAVKRFLRIDGAHWAGAFAFNAFFALFPLMILAVILASLFVDRDQAARAVIAYVESYAPLNGEMQHRIFGAIAGVVRARERAGAVALMMLVWAALQCFVTLVCAINRAWGEAAYSWWRVPLKSLGLLAVTTAALLLGMAAPLLARMGRTWIFPTNAFGSWAYALLGFAIPLVVLFLSLSLLYRVAPRRPTRFGEVWIAALCTTVLLQAIETLFVVYLRNFATLNAVYGSFGGIMALLLWIYFSGYAFIFGSCLCAAESG